MPADKRVGLGFGGGGWVGGCGLVGGRGELGLGMCYAGSGLGTDNFALGHPRTENMECQSLLALDSKCITS